jgi:hypothetical protein
LKGYDEESVEFSGEILRSECKSLVWKNGLSMGAQMRDSILCDVRTLDYQCGVDCVAILAKNA